MGSEQGDGIGSDKFLDRVRHFPRIGSEPKGLQKFTKENYKFYKDGQWTKYKNDLKELLPADDAVAQTIGKGWRMPTREDFQKIYTQCEWRYEMNYKGRGTHGYLVTNKNTPSNSIFIPCGGYFDEGLKKRPSRNYVDAYLWTSTLFPKELVAKDISIAVKFSNGQNTDSKKGADGLLPRVSGLNIRPVKTM